MFRWYANAAVCYTYLSDVEWCSDQDRLKSLFSSSRWFTRGWTLQELIAPSDLVFFSSEWQLIGTKSQLCQQISSITGIDEKVLNGANLEDVCIAKKMSWAANRKTRRIEDIAYCLLGVFDVNMPLIYGEGRKAFQRLQHEIMRSNTDPSLFAWGTIVDMPPGNCDESQILGLKAMDWVPPEERKPLLGLLAESPDWFKSCGSYSLMDSSSYYMFQHQKLPLPRLVDSGVMASFFLHDRVELRFAPQHWDIPRITQIRSMRIAIIFCYSRPDEKSVVGLPLFYWGEGQWARSPELMPINTNALGSLKLPEDSLLQMHIKPIRNIALEHGDILFRRYYRSFGDSIYSAKPGRYSMGHKVFQVKGRVEGDILALAVKNGENSFAFVLRRNPAKGKPLGALCAGVTRIQDGSDSDNAPTSDRIPGFEAVSRLPTYQHTMASPFDSWVCEEKGLPRVYFRCHRMPLNEKDSVDVVDIIIPKFESDIELMAKKWNDGLWLE